MIEPVDPLEVAPGLLRMAPSRSRRSLRPVRWAFPEQGKRGQPDTIASILAVYRMLAASGADAASTFPGRNSAYESVSGIVLPYTGSPATILIVTIIKGQPKRVLEAVATIAVQDDSTGTVLNLTGALLANGLAMEAPSSSSHVAGHYYHACYEEREALPVHGCLLMITVWLDLDAAEQTHPGLFKKQQIDAVLSGGGFDAFGGPVNGDATLSVRMEKK